MSIAALDWAWRQDCPNATSKLVLIALADKANDDGECWPGMEHVARMVGISTRQVSTHLQRLEDVGLLARKRRRSGIGRLGSYVFHLNVDHRKPASGSTPPVEGDRQWKDTSGSSPPVEADRHRKQASESTGSPASPPPEADFRTEPTVNPQGNPHSSDVPSDPQVSDDARALTREFAVAVKANGFKVPKRHQPSYRGWLVDMDRLVRLGAPGGDPDPQDPAEVREVIRFATTDNFWRSNIGSPTKFREQYPRLRLKMLDQAQLAPKQDPVAARYGAGAR